jgi:hypothetical protein
MRNLRLSLINGDIPEVLSVKTLRVCYLIVTGPARVNTEERLVLDGQCCLEMHVVSECGKI